MFFPATACLVQDRIGATNAWGFDLSAACSGFLYALTVGAQFVGAGTHKKALVIGSDMMTSILELRRSRYLHPLRRRRGRGADRARRRWRRHSRFPLMMSMAQAETDLFMPGGGSLNPSTRETVDKQMHYVHQDGQQVFKYAVRRMADVPATFIERNGFSSNDLALVVPHQANLRIIRAMQERLGVPDDSK